MSRIRGKHYPPINVLNYPWNEGWTILESPSGTGAVDLLTKTIYVPMGGSEYDRNVRFHEVAHAIWSRGRPQMFIQRHGLRWSASYQAMEDARIQKLLVLSEVDLDHGFLPPDQLRALAEASVSQRDYAGLCLILVAGAFSGSEDVIHRVVRAVALIEGAVTLPVLG